MGVKSAIQLSPNHEHSMSVTIASHGKDNELPYLDTTNDLTNINLKNKQILFEDLENKMINNIYDNDKQKLKDSQWKQKYRPTHDVEYDLLMKEVSRVKQNILNEVILFLI